MKDEYIIINFTAIQKRIEELEKEYVLISNKLDRSLSNIKEEREIIGEQKALSNLLSQSTPLIPEIEKAFGLGAANNANGKPLLSDYISNLKLDI